VQNEKPGLIASLLAIAILSAAYGLSVWTFVIFTQQPVTMEWWEYWIAGVFVYISNLAIETLIKKLGAKK